MQKRKTFIFLSFFILVQSLVAQNAPIEKQRQVGWTDAGYVLEGTTLEYIIYFQNTSSDTVANVIIQDALIPQLDTSSVSIIDSSHDYVMTLDTNSLITFTFDTIFLPDSATNFSGSQGFIQFSIDFIPDLEVGFLLENRARVFFDSLPPIQTNTASNILYSCEELSASTSPGITCLGDTMTIEALSELVETYTWILDGDTLASADSIIHIAPPAGGDYELVLITENFLCSDADTLMLTVEDLASPNIVNAGDSLYISNEEVLVGYVWYLDGEPLSNTGGVTIYDVMDAPGTYSVQAISFNGCESFSNEVVVVLGLEEQDEIDYTIYPNPMEEYTDIQFTGGAEARQLQLMDATGRILLDERVKGHSHRLYRRGLAPGQYTLLILDEHQTLLSSVSLLVL